MNIGLKEGIRVNLYNCSPVGVAKKKGKKRKLSEVDNSVTEVTAVQTNGQTATGLFYAFTS